MAAFRDSTGKIQILDRNGKTYVSLADIAPRYGTTEMILEKMLLVNNVFAKYIGPIGSTTLAVEVLGVNVSEKNK